MKSYKQQIADEKKEDEAIIRRNKEILEAFKQRPDLFLIRQYRPAFFSGFVNQIDLFSSVDELKKIPYVYGFTQSKKKDFYRFSLSIDQWQILLMAEYNDGKDWYVVGNIEGKDIQKLNLPKWIPVDDDKEIADDTDKE